MESQPAEDVMLAAMEREGLRRTKPRQALVAQVAAWGRDGVDFTAEELWRAVREDAPEVGRATVFRTMETLTNLGLLDRISFADGAERYHTMAPGAHHHHLTCSACHRVVNVALCIPEEALRAAASDAGFTLSGHRVELFGLCEHCQAEGEE